MNREKQYIWNLQNNKNGLTRLCGSARCVLFSCYCLLSLQLFGCYNRFWYVRNCRAIACSPPNVIMLKLFYKRVAWQCFPANQRFAKALHRHCALYHRYRQCRKTRWTVRSLLLTEGGDSDVHNLDRVFCSWNIRYCTDCLAKKQAIVFTKK